MTKEKRLIAVISLLLIVGFLITSLASYYVSVESLRSEISSTALPLTSDNIYSEIQRDLFRPVFISSLMANDTFLKDWIIAGEIDEGRIVKYLSEIKTKYKTLTSFFVSEKSRKYYYAEGILKEVSPDEERDVWYFRVRKMTDDYEINVDPDMANEDTTTIFVNYQVRDYQGNYIGAAGVGLAVNAVRELIEEYQEKYDRSIYFIDEIGDVKLAGSDFPKAIDNVFSGRLSPEYRDSVLTLDEEYFKYKNGNDVLHINTRYISELGWHLIVEQSEDQVTRRIFTTLLINLGICFLITLVVLALVYVSISSYQKRIETLKGIVPICSYCKKIRDDQGYWNQVDAYVSKHTEAEFSHGICPSCMEKNHPGDEDLTEEE